MLNGLIVILLFYAAIFITAEILYRKGCTVEVTRKVVHIGSGIVSFFLPLLVNLVMAVSIGIFFALFLLWTRAQHFLDSVHKADTSNFGAVFFPIGLVLCAIIFWNVNYLIFQGSALILGLSDGVAGIFGQRFGKRAYNFAGHKKTLEGSIVFFLVTVVILIAIVFFSQKPLILSKIICIVSGAFFLSLLEGLVGKGWDNLFIPLGSGVILYLVL